MMGQFEQLDQMLTEQEGMLRTSQVVSSGISKPVFYDYVRSRDLDRVAHGIYLSKDSWVDAMYLLHLRFEQAVFSHETALFFHDLTDREPIVKAVCYGRPFSFREGGLTYGNHKNHAASCRQGPHRKSGDQ